MESSKPKENKALNVIIAILLIGMVAFIASIFINGSKNNTDAEQKPLNLLITRTNTGLTVKNNEANTLTGCKISVNTKYSTKVQTIDSKERTYEWGEFTESDGTRFDIVATQPQEVFVSGCQEDKNRSALYQW
jgi:hypothetical protein